LSFSFEGFFLVLLLDLFLTLCEVLFFLYIFMLLIVLLMIFVFLLFISDHVGSDQGSGLDIWAVGSGVIEWILGVVSLGLVKCIQPMVGDEFNEFFHCLLVDSYQARGW
jgi:hypothetical protein